MANNLDANPVTIDSPMAGSFRNYQGPKYQPSAGRFKIVRVLWVGSARVATDNFTIKDGDPVGVPFATNPANIIATDTLMASPTGPTTYELGLEVMDFMVTTPPTHGALEIFLAPVD